MQIDYAGSIQGIRKYPYIYFIIKGDFLYVGQTQDIPVIRWGGHLTSNGTFSKKLRAKDAELYMDASVTKFFAFRCDKIQLSVNDIEKRTVTCFIEHRIHEKLICHKKVGPKYELISDTSRTAPRSCKYGWVDSVADEIIAIFLAELDC